MQRRVFSLINRKKVEITGYLTSTNLRYFGTFVQHRKITRILRSCEDYVMWTNMLGQRCEKDVVGRRRRKTFLGGRCEKDVVIKKL